ncbi:MAG: thioredoxin family protein, partial [Gammaproteobacteria bacterium]|nr:thioredoxin family protein [Gammaproteobacteria bacterium]
IVALGGGLLGVVSAVGDQLDPFSFDDSPRARVITHPDWFETSFLDLGEDLKDAVAAGKNGLMVYFGQKNCAYCEALMEINFKTPDIVRYTREHFHVIALDIWGSRSVTAVEGTTSTEHEFAVAQQTNFTPSIIFYDKTGRQAFKMTGYYPPYKFRAALEYVADDHYQRESFGEYIERADPPPKFAEEGLNEQNFFQPPPYALDRSRFAADDPLVVFFEQIQCHACDVLHTEPLASPGHGSLAFS